LSLVLVLWSVGAFGQNAVVVTVLPALQTQASYSIPQKMTRVAQFKSWVCGVRNNLRSNSKHTISVVQAGVRKPLGDVYASLDPDLEISLGGAQLYYLPWGDNVEGLASPILNPLGISTYKMGYKYVEEGKAEIGIHFMGFMYGDYDVQFGVFPWATISMGLNFNLSAN